MKKRIPKIILSALIGLLVFLILLGIANIMLLFYQNAYYASTIKFLNSSILIIVVMTLIFMIGEIFLNLMFPLNLPGPVFNAIGSLFLVKFLFNVVTFIDSLLKLGVFWFLDKIEFITFLIVFFGILLIGYIEILVKLMKKKKREEHRRRKRR